MVVRIDLYPYTLIHAIDDWQAGANGKDRKARQLRKTSQHLPRSYRKAPTRVFRQVRVNAQLGIGMALDASPDAVSSWTTSEDVARRFRENDQDRSKVMVIFGRSPAPDDIILDLNAVYADSDFMDTVRADEERLGKQFRGINRWRDTQKEVVLNETVIGNDEIVSLGAFRELRDIVPAIGARDPNAPSDREIFKELTGVSSDEHFWTTPDSTAEGIRRAAERARTFLKEKKLWPQGRPE